MLGDKQRRCCTNPFATCSAFTTLFESEACYRIGANEPFAELLTTKMVVLVLTGLEDEERTRYSQLHARVQAGLADLGISQVCVTSTPVRRTLKLLTALAHGAWVVGEEYLQACARSRSTLDPAPFELVSQIPGCRAARLGGCGSALQRS